MRVIDVLWNQVCLNRQAKLILRNRQFIRVHLLQDTIMGLLMGSLFWNMQLTSFQVKMGQIL